MNDLPDIVAAVSGLLARLSIDHCLIGGMALAVHRFPRATHDVDFLAVLPDDLAPLLTAAEEANLIFDDADKELAEEGLVFLRVGSPKGPRVDLLNVAEDVERRIVERATPVSFADTEVPVIQLEDLVAMKLATGRLRDDADAEELLQRSEHLSLPALYAVARHFDIEEKTRHFTSAEEE